MEKEEIERSKDNLVCAREGLPSQKLAKRWKQEKTILARQKGVELWDKRIKKMSFDEWFKKYPKRAAIGLARQAYSNSILFKGVTEDLLMQAVEAYAKLNFGKDKQFIPDPHKWLQAERWHDEDIQHLIDKDREKRTLEGWRKSLSDTLGFEIYSSWCKDGNLEDSTLILKSAFKAQWLKNNHMSDLERAGITQIKVSQ